MPNNTDPPYDRLETILMGGTVDPPYTRKELIAMQAGGGSGGGSGSGGGADIIEIVFVGDTGVETVLTAREIRNLNPVIAQQVYIEEGVKIGNANYLVVGTHYDGDITEVPLFIPMLFETVMLSANSLDDVLVGVWPT